MVSVRGFRNLLTTDPIELSPDLTLVSGANAQGKTNFLEAIGLLLAGQALRGQSEPDMVGPAQEGYRLTGIWQERDLDGDEASVSLSYAVSLHPVRRKRLGPALPVVWFSPDDVWIVKGGPEGRRRLIDQQASQLYPQYPRELRRYLRALAQRNRALKGGDSWSLVDSFSTILAESGSYLWEKRQSVLEAWRPALSAVAGNVADGDQPGLALVSGGHPEHLNAAGLLRGLESRRDEERQRGMTLTGPHRDDLLLTINGESARQRASQGQQRTLALSLKLASRDLLEAALGRRPVVLLDDVLSELDGSRQQALLRLMVEKDQQTIVTDTSAVRYQHLTPWHLVVDNGRITRAVGA